MDARLRWLKYTVTILLGWAILWPALAGTTRLDNGELKVVASTPSETGAVEPLVAGSSFGISFVCPEDNLAALEFRVATYQRINPARLVMLLYRADPKTGLNLDPAGRIPIRRVIIGAAGLSDWGPARFEFKPLPDSAGKVFYAVVLSPGTKVFQCVGLVMARVSETPPWRGYSGGEPTPQGPAVSLLTAVPGSGRYSGWWWLMAAVPLVVVGIGWLRS